MSSQHQPRIAILGAGPSGLTLAYCLQTLGIKEVHVFESQNEVGGQSVTKDVEGFPVELGTVYLTKGYVLAKQIARQVGCPVKILPEATVLDDQGDKINPPSPGKWALARYVLLWLRWYWAGQLRIPNQEENSLSFEEWLHQKGLKELADGFTFTAGLTAQLYGPLDAISAHSGLNWVRPSLLLTGRLKKTGHIPQGFQNLWKKLQEHLRYPVHFGRQIDTVQPLVVEGEQKVKLLSDGESVAEPFDHVFLACPLDYLDDPLKPSAAGPRRHLQHPLSEALKNRFSPFDSTEVYSGAWKAKKDSWPSWAPSRCYLPAATTGDVGPLLTIRNYGMTDRLAVGQFCSYALPKEDSANDEGGAGDEGGEGYEERLERNRAQVVRDMEEIVGLREVEIVHQRLWRYNIRYSQAQLREGLPAYLHDAQGKEHVWYTGGTLSHWNIDAITDYNFWLALRFGRKARLPIHKRLRFWTLKGLLSEF